jgi:hypothetical protein
MSLFPEREPKIKPVEERPEEISPLTIERKEVIQPKVTQFTKKVTDDNGKPLVQTPEDKEIKIELPASSEQLEKASKGSADNSLTWFATFWLRVFKKAIRFNWKLFEKNSSSQS